MRGEILRQAAGLEQCGDFRECPVQPESTWLAPLQVADSHHTHLGSVHRSAVSEESG